ncbi:MAG: ATP-binding protein, partial [Chloroflexota bacterium]|nr:ATP-binding protein [Chloroflexota bacterium]
EALATLSSILDRAEAARQLARMCVPRLADFCAIDLLDPDGSIHQLAVAHVDPDREALAWQLRHAHPVHSQDETGPARVVREGRPEFVVGLDPQASGANGGGLQPDVAAMIQLGLISWLRVPLLARKRPIGALTLARADRRRTLDEHDLTLAEELGARAGIALENARLYESAEDRRSQLDAVLAAMADAVLVFDTRGRLRLTNRAAERLFAGDPPRTVEQLGQRVRTADAGTEERQQQEPASTGERTRDALADLEGELQLAGSERWYELRRYRSRPTSADRGERGGPFVVVLRDVTDERAARAAREAFLGVLSHELRTPITMIYGGSELLERTTDEAAREEVLRDIRVDSERLARLVEDLLVMTRVERGGVEIGDEPVLMQRLIPKVARSMETRLPGLAIETDVGENLPAVRGDATYLEQVLRNLLTNGVRYGSGLERGLRVIADERDDTIQVRVLDRGAGLTDQDPERLFELFYRSPAAHAVPGGAGIGLFVCRRLVEAMGGRIWARSRSDGGAEFVFAVPIIEPDVA